jgi:hypothetical protein
MRTFAVACAALGAALVISGEAGASPSAKRGAERIGLIRHDNVQLRSAPDSRSAALSLLEQESQVAVLAQHAGWDHVAVWSGVPGWVPTSAVVFRRPWTSASTYRAPTIRAAVRAAGPFSLRVTATATANLPLQKWPSGPVAGRLRSGDRFAITGWMQDGAGHAWYRVGPWWVSGASVRFIWSPRAKRSPNGSGVERVSGKGMWLTLGTIAGTAPAAILDETRRAGITHLFLESAISPLGFHGRLAVGPLLDAAHRHHIAVIAWVYPYLEDVATDVTLTRQVAAFRSSAGSAFDGIAADLESNVNLATVRTYGQLIRAYLGPDYPLVGVTYPPQTMPAYPYAEVANDFDVIAPMDYWHETRTGTGLDYQGLTYGWTYGYRFAANSITEIRKTAGATPVAPIGQTFDDFGRLEMGPYAPSAQEEEGFIAGSKRSGAIGVSFFQWMTATVDEWHAIQAFQY